MPVIAFAPAAGEVSVIVVAYGQRQMTERLLRSLATHSGDVEVIVVDNDSPDDTVDWLDNNVSGIRVIPVGRNLGFGAGCNLGVRAARGRFVALLNTDVEVEAGWLGPLIRAMTPGVSAAAPVFTDERGDILEAGASIGQDGRVVPCTRAPDTVTAVPHASAACLLLRRRDVLDVGGFDESYGLGYHEDVDLLAALQQLGYGAPVVVPEVRVRHRVGGSFGSELATELGRRNLQRSGARWSWQRRHLSTGLDATASALRRRHGRALIIGDGADARAAATRLRGAHLDVVVDDALPAGESTGNPVLRLPVEADVIAIDEPDTLASVRTADAAGRALVCGVGDLDDALAEAGISPSARPAAPRRWLVGTVATAAVVADTTVPRSIR